MIKLNGLEMFKHLFTGIDNQTYDVGRVLWVMGVIVLLGLSIVSVFLSHEFNAINFGTGFGGILAGGGAGIGLKAKTEPERRDDHE